MFRVRIKAWAKTEGIDNAASILTGEVNDTLDSLGRHLQRSLRSRVRIAVGDEKRNIKYEVKGRGLNKLLTVYGDTVQLAIDQWGLPPGTFPRWATGSRLFRYVQRKAQRPDSEGRQARGRRRVRKASHVLTRRPGPRSRRGDTRKEAGRVRRATTQGQRSPQASARQKAIRRLAWLAARSIFEHGIKAGNPVGRTFDANRAKIIRDLAAAFRRGVNIINRGHR